MISLEESMNCPICTKPAASNPVECERCAALSNWCRLLLMPISLGPNVSVKDTATHNQKWAFANANKFVEDMSTDELFVCMKKLEALAAGMNLAHSQRLIKNRVGQETVEQAIERQSTFANAVKETRDAQRPKKERKMLDDRGKAIAALVALGIDEHTAATQVDARMSQVGRAVQPLVK